MAVNANTGGEIGGTSGVGPEETGPEVGGALAGGNADVVEAGQPCSFEVTPVPDGLGCALDPRLDQDPNYCTRLDARHQSGLLVCSLQREQYPIGELHHQRRRR